MNADIKTSRSGGWWLFASAVVVVVAVFSLSGPGIALGASQPSSQGTSAASDQYAKPAKVAASSSPGGNSTPPPASTATGGTLPFTGVSLIWPAVAAFALVGFGLALRRHERKNG
jgi:hypothetical protein